MTDWGGNYVGAVVRIAALLPLAEHSRSGWNRPIDVGTFLNAHEIGLDELRVARSTFDSWRALGTAPKCIKLPNCQLRMSRAVPDAWLDTRVETVEVA